MSNKPRQYALIFGALVTALLAGTAISVAQSAPVYSSDAILSGQVTTNQCTATGEPVSLSGTVHFQYSFTTDSNGVNHFSISAASNLTGVGQTSAASYSASDSSSYTVNSSDASADLTVNMKSDLVSQRSGAGLSLVQTLHMTVNTSGNVTGQVVQSTTQCGS